MKSRVTVLMLVGVLVAGATCWARAGATTGGGSHARTFQFRYLATVTQIPREARTARIWVPLASSRENQRVLGRAIHSPYPYEVAEEPAFGNEVAYLQLTAPLPESVSIDVAYDVAVEGIQRLSPGTPPVPPSDRERELALRDESLLVVNDGIKRLAMEATMGQTTELARARALYDYVIQKMAYDKAAPGWGKGDTMRACLLGKGNCTDFHSLFISMSRSIGIPSRFVIGAPVPEGPVGAIPGYHCWAEFYHPDYGWVPVDASEAWKHPERKDYYFGSADPNRMLISVGRNIELVPKQDGPPVNIFIYPYVEIDGRPGATVETRFEYADRNGKEVRG